MLVKYAYSHAHRWPVDVPCTSSIRNTSFFWSPMSGEFREVRRLAACLAVSRKQVIAAILMLGLLNKTLALHIGRVNGGQVMKSNSGDLSGSESTCETSCET